MLALDFDAGRKNFIWRVDVEENAAVVRLGRDFHEAPFDGQFVIAMTFFRPRITEGLARTMNDFIRDRPGQLRLRIAAHEKCPAGKIFSVEQLDVTGRNNRLRRILGEALRGEKGTTEDNGTGKGCEGFHSSARIG